MAPCYVLKIMIRDVINNDLLFDGKIIIFGGDFRQLLIVLPRGIRSKIVNSSIKKLFSNITARNVDVNELNQDVVSLLDRYTERIYTKIDSIDNCDDNGLMANAILQKYLKSRSSMCTSS